MSFGSKKEQIKGIGKIGSVFVAIVHNVLYVEGLKYNLLNISQFCDCGYAIVFDKDACIVKNSNRFVFFTAQRKHNLYEINLTSLSKQNVTCLVSKEDKKHNFSSPRTSQQNEMVERRNITLQEIARTFLCENDLTKYFWAKAVNTTSYIQNRILIRPLLNKAPCECYILNTKDQLGKFDSKVDKGIFLGMEVHQLSFLGGKVLRNKARLVAQGYNQQEGIGFTETFTLVARLKVIRIMLAFFTHKNIKKFQMDVKSAFLNEFIEEKVYIKQPLGFENHKLKEHVFKLKKVIYCLKQAPRAWYDRLTNFLLNNNFVRGKVDTTLFRKESGIDFIVVQIYVDDIIFGATNKSLCNDFSKLM
uniref:Retrovirus-related Pol polyprotein from transposon TNT 1-94 n=1 Tax=Cajanus cajan TaxID=3821 RepID=A0A151SWT1_CAJCA|nr:Retrovirus-related Pol polyprotein from transposon TNT 1-94 [Cajanus cajan]